MIGVPLGIDQDGSSMVAVVAEAVDEVEAAVVPKAVAEAADEVEAAVEAKRETTMLATTVYFY